MFDFYVQVKRAFGTIELLALLIRALVHAFNVIGASTVMLLTA
jgi:hypothetical protein